MNRFDRAKKHVKNGRMTYTEKLLARIDASGSRLCVGIDPRPDLIGGDLETALERFVDETTPYAACFKPNIAYFEALGSEGYALLERLIERIDDEVPILLDAKRGDIGATQEYYAKAYFDRMDVDAVTLNAFMGFDAIEPFLKYENRAVYLLAVTSNAGSADIELQKTDTGRYVFELVQDMAQRGQDAGLPGEVGLVVGLTNVSEEVISRVDDLPLLLPGLGAQGGDVASLAGQSRQAPMLINVSRGVLFPSEGKSHAEAAAGFVEAINSAFQ
ncbi:MAG: orotidine-5'-phosphate decarboxylase [Verrucomicrobiales bacterium]|jgi:orotidine-5'-phosphate decarboxylase